MVQIHHGPQFFRGRSTEDRLAVNQKDVGSNPTLGATKIWPHRLKVRIRLFQGHDESSSLSGVANRNVVIW